MEENTKLEANYEDPEGLGGDELLDLKGYPIDNLLIRTEQRSVFEIVRRINSGVYIMDPEFQRDYLWEPKKQCRLIESALMRLPLPVFYLAEREDGKIIVVDGLQRLKTFQRFLNDEFTLRGIVESLNKLKFSKLPPKLQSRLEDTNLILYLIDSKVPERAKLDIFERVNSGVPLTRQQMRNSLYLGEGTRFLKLVSQSDDFLKATRSSLDSKRMVDREFINRYCAYSLLGLDKYSGEMDTYLIEALKIMNNMSKDELANLKSKFLLSMRNNYLVFGEMSFRKHEQGIPSKNKINAAIFDVYSILMSKWDTKYVEHNKKIIRRKFYELLNNEEFKMATTLSTSDVKRVLSRFKLVDEFYKELYNA